jgi:hypothetical protein
MNKPDINVKDILAKLSFFKNNLTLLVPVIIAVIALLLFIPTRILSGRLKTAMEQQSKRPAQNIDRLIRQVDEAAESEDYGAYIEQLEQDANNIEAMMLQTTQRELLSYEIFPDTNETSPLLFERFGTRYMNGLETLLQDVGAGEPPTESEIELALEKAPKTPLTMRGPYGGGADYGGYSEGGPYDMMEGGYPGGGYAGGGRGGLRGYGPMQRKIVDEICQSRARELRVYGKLADLAGYTFWADWQYEARDVAYKDCWYWQLAYWVMEDVFATVDAMNEPAPSIAEAPVKRLLGVAFSVQRGRRGRGRGIRLRGGGVRKTDTAYPTYVTDPKNALTDPCTGRLSNDTVHVIQFTLDAVVAANDVMAFMQELCSAKPHQFRGWEGDQPVQTYKHNQITVLESNVQPVNPRMRKHDLYWYGDEAVVELSLVCEYIFQTAAYQEVIPQYVKDEIAGVEVD